MPGLLSRALTFDLDPRLEEAIDYLFLRQFPIVSQAFTLFSDVAGDDFSWAQIANILYDTQGQLLFQQQGNITEQQQVIINLAEDKILDVLQDYIKRYSQVLPKTFVASAQDELKRVRQAFDASNLKVKQAKWVFNTKDTQAVKAMEQNRLQFVRDFTQSQRDMVRQFLVRGIREGRNPIDTARQFRDVIGLTRNQEAAVANYRRALQRGNRDALSRVLRDRRFDRMVARAADEGNVIPDRQLERMVQRYAQKMVQYRAQTIARTETLRSLNQGRQAAWLQMLTQHNIAQGRVERTWLATLDDRVRDNHEAMHHQRVIGFNTPFESPDGDLLMYPGDPTASPENVINCRCTVVMMIRQPRAA